jgi:hypothetical protein
VDDGAAVVQAPSVSPADSTVGKESGEDTRRGPRRRNAVVTPVRSITLDSGDSASSGGPEDAPDLAVGVPFSSPLYAHCVEVLRNLCGEPEVHRAVVAAEGIEALIFLMRRCHAPELSKLAVQVGRGGGRAPVACGQLR